MAIIEKEIQQWRNHTLVILPGALIYILILRMLKFWIRRPVVLLVWRVNFHKKYNLINQASFRHDVFFQQAKVRPSVVSISFIDDELDFFTNFNFFKVSMTFIDIEIKDESVNWELGFYDGHLTLIPEFNS